MKKPLNIKKFLLPNIPYVFIALFATKLGQAARLSPGADFSGKALHLMEGFAAAFQSALPSFHPIDLCVGVAAALLIRLIVYVKGKNAKKFRKNLEYGSARWGRPEDIAPYVDPKFENNVILTQTERLMMSNRPKDPKTARNKKRAGGRRLRQRQDTVFHKTQPHAASQFLRCHRSEGQHRRGVRKAHAP